MGICTWLRLGVAPLPWAGDITLGDLSGLPGNHVPKKRAPCLLEEGQAEPQPASHQTGSMSPGVGHFSTIPEEPAPRFQPIWVSAVHHARERLGGGGSLY